MSKLKALVPTETLRLMRRKADRLQRLNPNEPVSNRISQRLKDASTGARSSRTRVTWSAWLYLLGVCAAFTGFLYWFLSGP